MTVESAPPASKATKIAKTANGVADTADRKVSELARRAESAAKRAETVLHDGIEALRTHGQAYAETATRRFDDAKVTVSEKVRERPLTGLLAAAGVGLLVGLLLSSGRRH